jgi:hypothetical protein
LSKLRLTFACWNYDRTRAISEGRVQPEGIDLNYLSLPFEETFFRMLRYGEFDVAEMSLSSYVMSLFKSEPMLPWLPAHIEETRREMGADFWPYGLQPNHHTLETFLRYSYEQGLSKRLLEPAQLFVPETLESFKI